MLKFISDLMDELNIDYEFGEWTSEPVPDPYFVGEYIESESMTLEENGYQDSTMIITGTGTTWLDLERAKNTIKNNLPRTAILDDKSGIAVSYGNSLVVPTGDAELKRIQINLNVMKWSVS